MAYKIMTKSDAMAAIETANWDAYDSALPGAEIWGVHGQFAAPRAASHYTYQLALQEVERYDWDQR